MSGRGEGGIKTEQGKEEGVWSPGYCTERKLSPASSVICQLSVCRRGVWVCEGAQVCNYGNKKGVKDIRSSLYYLNLIPLHYSNLVADTNINECINTMRDVSKAFNQTGLEF